MFLVGNHDSITHVKKPYLSDLRLLISIITAPISEVSRAAIPLVKPMMAPALIPVAEALFPGKKTK